MARHIELYPLEFYDDIRKRWIRARYVAERHVIEERYAQFRIVGEPEVRDEGDLYGLMFRPSAAPKRPGSG